MSTLSDRTPLSTLAHILHAAAIVGSGAWDRGKQSDPLDSTSDSEMSRDLGELFKLLRDRQIPYLLVGGVALLRYIDGRNTDDLDLIVAGEALEKVPEIVVEDRNPEAARAKFKSIRVDLLFTRNPVFRLVQEQHATTHRFAEIDVRCATVDGLVLLKLYALPSLYSQNDLQRAALYETDLAMLCLRHSPSMASLVESLKKHVTAPQFEELNRIIGEIETRVGRMRNK